MRLQTSLGAVLAASCAVCALATSASLLAMELAGLRDKHESESRLVLDAAMRAAEQAVVSEDFLILPGYLESLRGEHPGILRARFRRGGVWTESGTFPADLAARKTTVLSDKLRAAKERSALLVELTFSEEALEGERRALLREGLRRTAWAGLFSFLASVALGSLLAGRLIRPIRSLVKLSESLARGRLDAQVDMSASWPDEFRALGAEFNSMALKLKELDRMKRDFVTSVTHELRSPLGAIESCARLLLESSETMPAAERSELLSHVRGNAQRLEHLVTNMLELARVERGSMEFVPEPTDLAELVRDTVLFMRPRAEEKRLTLAIELPARSPRAYADRARLQQVLVNLVSNAVKFTAPGGKATVYVQGRGEWVECGVRDTGCGIAADDLERIFQPFERGRRTSKAEGTGLGLALAKVIVEMHGGRIAAESTPGSGSRVYFRVPAMEDSQASGNNSDTGEDPAPAILGPGGGSDGT